MAQAPVRRTPRRGKWACIVLAGIIISFTVWKQFFATRDHVNQAEAAVEPLTPPLKPIQMPAEQEPPPKPLPQKPQAQSPRPQSAPQPARPQKSEWQKKLEEKRLAGAWARPIGEKQQSSNGHSPGQTLEIPSQQGQNGQVGQLQKPVSPYMVNVGWLIPVRLKQPINTDVKGPIVAEVIQPVMDSATGKHELIPPGTEILGSYSTQVLYSAERLSNTWHTMVFRNGSTMPLGQMPGVDSTGTAGLNIKTNNHFWGTVLRGGLVSLTGAAGLIAAEGAYNGGDLSPADALGIEASREIRSTGRSAAARGLHRPPTGTAQAGEVFFVQVTGAPLVFSGPYRDRNEDEEVDYADAE